MDQPVTDEERIARATLSYVAEPGGALAGRLVELAGAAGALEAVRTGEPPPGLPADARMASLLEGWRARLRVADPETDLAICERLGGRLICPGDAEWPTQLAALGPIAPHALWLRGPADLRYGCLRSVAVVGARAATPYGLRVAADMAAELADRRWTVVSGGALGIDGAAHRGSLAACPPGEPALTFAVLACGTDVPYPPSNETLLREMAERGLLVSEWPPGTHPTRGRFLVRNRVIAALTRGTVVVEADLRSGSLNTAGYALRLNRPVLAVPGPVTSLLSRGCHQWLRDGRATCVSEAAEVVDSLGVIGDDLAPDRRGPVLARDGLDPDSARVLDAFPAARATLPTAGVAVAAGLDLLTTRSRLSVLAAAGFIEHTPEGWRLTRP